MKKIFIFLFMLMILASGYTFSQTSTDAIDNAAISARYHLLNPNDVDAILTDNFSGQQNDGQLVWNKEQHRAFLSDGNFKRDSVFQQVAQGNWVATRFVRRMFYNGDTIRAVAMQFKRFENGKIAEIWEYFDPSQAEKKRK